MAERRTRQRGENVALLVIDMQNELFRKSTPIYNEANLLATISSLIERAHQSGALVAYIQHSAKRYLVKGTEDWALHPRFHAEARDLIIHKLHPNSFLEMTLESELEIRGVGVVVVTGLVTHGCVRATCEGAKELGYRVILVEDGHSNYHKQPVSLIEETHAKLREHGIELTCAQEISFAAPVAL